MFRGTTCTGDGPIVGGKEDNDFVDETAATAEKRCPEVLKREIRWPIEQLCLFDVRRECDELLAVLAVGAVKVYCYEYEVNNIYKLGFLTRFSGIIFGSRVSRFQGFLRN